MSMKAILAAACAALTLCGTCRADSLTDVNARNAKLPDYKTLHNKVDNFEKPMMWLFVGDSITHGCQHTHTERNFVEHWMEIVKWEYGPKAGTRKYDIIINTGVSGETATGFLPNAKWRLGQFKTDVVFIMFGINDANKVKDLEKFKKDLSSIVGMVRKAKAIPVLQVPMLTTDGQANRPDYAEAVRTVADKEKCLLVDHAAHWKEASGSDTAKAEWMNNALHPNALGHRIMAYTIAKELGIQPNNSPTLKLPTP